jgi:hypothetical protein
MQARKTMEENNMEKNSMKYYVTYDGSWGNADDLSFIEGVDLTETVLDVLENGSDADRRELYYEFQSFIEEN